MGQAQNFTLNPEPLFGMVSKLWVSGTTKLISGCRFKGFGSGFRLSDFIGLGH